MPWTLKQKKAMYAEISRREKGKKPWRFKGMSLAKLKREVKKPTKRKK
jgi:hypothetical protein